MVSLQTLHHLGSPPTLLLITPQGPDGDAGQGPGPLKPRRGLQTAYHLRVAPIHVGIKVPQQCLVRYACGEEMQILLEVASVVGFLETARRGAGQQPTCLAETITSCPATFRSYRI